MATIPASLFVNVNPSVVSAGGDAIDVIGLLLTTSSRVPIGSVASFASQASVASYFGDSSREAELAGLYFSGFDGSNAKPGSVLFAQYPSEAAAAWLRGGDVSDLTLDELRAISGTLTVIFDGIERAAGSVDLGAAVSFSSAGVIIETALNAAAPNPAALTGSISGTTLTVTAVSSGTIYAGSDLAGTVGGVVEAGTLILEQLSGSAGGTGTYLISVSQTVGSTSLVATPGAVDVTYDSVSGAFLVTSGIEGAVSTASFATGTTAAALKLTDATGAVLSQGADAAVPATFMNGIIAVTTNWVTFMTTFNPDAEGETTVRQAFADWNSGKNNRYVYVCGDSDPGPAAASSDDSCLAALLDADGDSGTALVWAPDDDAAADLAAFVCGAAASIDFEQTNGRISFAFKSQSGFDATVTDETTAVNLGGNPQENERGNGYNYYGAISSANTGFIWFQRGFVTGRFLWIDSYVNQVWFNAQCQLALLTLLNTVKSIPYNAAGAAQIEAALSDTIQAGLNFGAFAPGTISQSQQATVNAQAGKDIASTLQTQGYYLQVKQASSAARAARTSPPCTLWYLDRGSVQAINLNSVAVQ